jgi:hypothetical protein
VVNSVEDYFCSIRYFVIISPDLDFKYLFL